MAIDRNRLEFERIRNLVRNFGWEVQKEEITEDKLVMTLTRARVIAMAGTEGTPAG